MLPELSLPFAALARTRAAPCQPDAAPADTPAAQGCFADEMSETDAVGDKHEDEDEADQREDSTGRSPAAPQAQTGPEPAASAGTGAPDAALVSGPGGADGPPAQWPPLPGADGVEPIRDGQAQAPAWAGRSPMAAAVPASMAPAGAPEALSLSQTEPGAVLPPDGAEAAATPSAAGASSATGSAGAGGIAPGAMARPAPGDAAFPGMAAVSASVAKAPAASDREANAAPTAAESDGTDGTDRAAGSRTAAGVSGLAPGDPRTVPVAGAEAGGTGGGSDGSLPDRAGTDAAGIASLSGADRAGATPADAARAADPRSAAPQTIGSQIVDGIRQARDGSIEIALSPEELGKLRVTIAGDDLNLHVRIHADRPETEGLLRRHIALLQQDFHDLGYGQVAFDFGPRQDQAPRFAMAPQGEAGPETGVEAVPAAAGTPLRPTGTPASCRGLDLRL